MKILHILNSRLYSGAENVVCTIIKHMPEDYECVYMSPKGPIQEKLSHLGIAYYGVDKLNPGAIKKALRMLQPDVIHAHDFRAGVYAAMAADKSVVCISHIHCNPHWLGGVNANTILYRIASKRFHKIVTVSHAFIEEYRWAKMIEDKTETMGNPFSPAEVRKRVENQQVKYELAFVGRLEEEKNPLGFIEIVDRVRGILPGVSAVMVGSGSLEEACRKAILERGLQSCIAMVGYQDNPYRYMAQSKLIVMPSKWEGFGLVALEAMALGKPVAASPVGGLRQLVNDQCGKLCSNAMEYEQELSMLLSNEEAYQCKSRGAREQAEQYDNIGQYIERVIKIYAGALY